MSRFEIKLSDEQRARLKALADATKVPSANLTRLAIEQMLDEREVRLPVPRNSSETA